MAHFQLNHFQEPLEDFSDFHDQQKGKKHIAIVSKRALKTMKKSATKEPDVEKLFRNNPGFDPVFMKV